MNSSCARKSAAKEMDWTQMAGPFSANVSPHHVKFNASAVPLLKVHSCGIFAEYLTNLDLLKYNIPLNTSERGREELTE